MIDWQHRPALRQYFAGVGPRRLAPVAYLRHAAYALHADCWRSGGTGTGVEKMVPTANTPDVCGEAQKLTLAFWEAVVQVARISGRFRELARGNTVALTTVSRISEN